MLDARGLSCPLPVVMVQKEVKKNSPQELTVLADNKVAVENVSRFAINNGYAVEVSEDNGEYSIKLTKQ
jgi:TusA-related sulfurtransferase